MNLFTKRTSLVLIICTAYVSTISCQMEKENFDVKWSKKIRLTPFFESGKVIMADDNYIYYLFGSKNGKPISGIPTIYETIVKYDRKKNDFATLKLKLSTGKEERIRLNVVAVDSLIHVVSYSNDKNKKVVSVYDDTVSPITLKFRNDSHKISEISYDGKEYKNPERIRIDFKNDNFARKKYMQLLTIFVYKNEDVYHYEAFDNHFESKVKYKKNLSINSRGSDFVFDKDFNLYTIERICPIGSNYDFVSSKFTISCHPKDGSQIIRKELSIENKSFPGVSIDVNNNNQLVCAGVYSNKNTNGQTGVFSILYEAKLQGAGAMQKTDFDLETLIKGLSKKNGDKILKKISAGKEYDDFYDNHMHPLHFRKDGGFDVIVEKRNSILMGKVSDYNYGDVYFLSFNANGSIKWIQKSARDQIVGENLISGAIHFLTESFFEYGENDEINMIYKLVDSSNLFQPIKNLTFIYSIDTNGKASEKLLQNDDNKSLLFIFPAFSYGCGKNTYIVVKGDYMEHLTAMSFVIGELKVKN